MKLVMGVVLSLAALSAVAAAFASFFADVEPPSPGLLWAIAGIVFAERAAHYFEAES